VPGQYTYIVTLAGEGLIGDGNWIKPELWWTDDQADPWVGNYGLLAGEWVQLTTADNGAWRTISTDFAILPGDPAVGTYFSPWIHNQNYDGHIILGEASLTMIPAPGAILLSSLGVGLVGWLRWRRTL
jgi:hypothetical protein